METVTLLANARWKFKDGCENLGSEYWTFKKWQAYWYHASQLLVPCLGVHKNLICGLPIFCVQIFCSYIFSPSVATLETYLGIRCHQSGSQTLSSCAPTQPPQGTENIITTRIHWHEPRGGIRCLKTSHLQYNSAAGF